MNYDPVNKCYAIRLVSADEIGLQGIDELFFKYSEFLRLLQESIKGDGRKTRATKRRADELYHEIMGFEIASGLKLKPIPNFKMNGSTQENGTHSTQNGIKNRSSNALSEDSLDTEVNISRYMNGLAIGTISSSSHDTQSNASSDVSSESSRPNTRQMARARQQIVRTPLFKGTNAAASRPRKRAESPMTPTNQCLRAYLKSQPINSADSTLGSAPCSSGGSSVINAALNQQHPALQMYKTRQLINTNKQLSSAQKRREEEEERKRALLNEKLMNLARAEAQREQLKAEKSQMARQRREERTRKVADVRAQQTAKAREQVQPSLKNTPSAASQNAKNEQKSILLNVLNNNQHNDIAPLQNGTNLASSVRPVAKKLAVEGKHACKKSALDAPTKSDIEFHNTQTEIHPPQTKLVQNGKQEVVVMLPPPQSIITQLPQEKNIDKTKENGVLQAANTTKTIISAHNKSGDKDSKDQQQKKELNATYEKPEVTNIEISIADEDQTLDESPQKPQRVADWARAPQLRGAIIEQFTNPNYEKLRRAIFPEVEPVDLEKVFGRRNAVTEKYLRRTSSAVWSPPPNQGIKRSSSAVFTPDRQ